MAKFSLSYTALVMQAGSFFKKGAIVITGPLHKKLTLRDIQWQGGNIQYTRAPAAIILKPLKLLSISC